MHRPLFCASLALALSVLSPLQARAETLPDSTSVESWRLANGMEVRVRDIPGAAGYSVTLAYGAGALDMPTEDASLARLLAELQFTAPASGIPERSRDELDSVRPAGWELRVTDHLAVLSEMATREQFAGVLKQVATRAHGVQVGDTCFRAAMASVRRQLAENALGSPDFALHYRVRDVARGLDDATSLAIARGRDLAGVDRERAAELIARLYVPSNCAMALAGDFSRQPVRALVERLFSDIPAGTPATEVAPAPLVAGTRTGSLPGLKEPVSVIGIIPPALDDTMHAACYLASVIMAGWWREHSGRPRPPLGSAYRYSPVDEPDLIRYFLSSNRFDTLAEAARATFFSNLDGLRGTVVDVDGIRSVRATLEWVLGGPLPPPILQIARQQVASLGVISAGAAMRARWRGDEFWSAYRTRFMTNHVAPSIMYMWMQDPRHVVALTLVPRK